MRISQWAASCVLLAVMAVLKYPLAIVAVLFYSTPDRLHLTRFTWLETFDSDLTGDEGWRREHLFGNDPLSWYNRVRWLYRNGGGRVSFGFLGCPDSDTPGRTPGKYFYLRRDGFWMYRRDFPIGSRHLDIFLGWGFFGPSRGRCKIELSVRLMSRTP